MGRNTAVRPYFSQACAAAAAKTPAFCQSPGQRRRAKQMYFPSGSAPTALSAASTSSAGGGGQGQRRVRGQNYLRLRHAEARELLDAVRLAERMASTQELSTFRVLATPPGRFTGPMPQPYIMTLQPRRLAGAQGEEVVPEAPAAGDVLYQAAAAVYVQRAAAHGAQEAGDIEGVYRVHIEALFSALRVAGEDGYGHERVYGAHLGSYCVQDGLVAGVAMP